MNKAILHTICTLLLVTVLAGCGLTQPQPTLFTTQAVTAPPTPARTAVPTANAAATPIPGTAIPVLRTPTPAQGTATPAPVGATPVPGTATPVAAAPTPVPQRITFAAGATQATVSGSLTPNTAARYVLEAGGNQYMRVEVSPQLRAQVAVYGADGTVLQSPSAGLPGFSGYLPSTQDYIIVLSAGDQALSYTMNVIIPERVSFAAGTTTTTVQGSVPANSTHHYILGAQANQLMQVEVSPDQGVQLVIYGVDGTVLKSGMSNLASFRGAVPSTQDYIVTISGGSTSVSYTMNVIIPERIQFAPGATSATIQDSVPAYSAQYYVLGAAAGQVMDVNVSPQDGLRMSIYGVDGTVLMSGMGEGTVFHGEIPTTQDYIVVVLSSNQAAGYTMIVSIP